MDYCDNINCHREGQIYIPDTKLPRIIIVGGGFAGMKLARSLRSQQVQMVLFDKNNYHQFIPLLYQVATSGIEPDSIVFPYRKLFRKYSNLIYRMAEVIHIQTEKKIISTSIGEISFDYLILATGSVTNYFGNAAIEKYSLELKSITNALDIRSFLLQNLEEAVLKCVDRDKIALASVMIVGGGAAGIEMAGALAEFNKYILPRDYPELKKIPIKIILCEGADRLLQTMPEKLSEKSYKYLTNLGVEIKLNTIVKKYNNKQVEFANGELTFVSALIWAAGVMGEVIPGFSKESISAQGRLLVDDYNRINGLANIYAIGDIAFMQTEKFPLAHPMVAQVAIQQGNNLAKNIINELKKKPWQKFDYHDKGSMATIGKKKAIAYINRISVWGFTAWFLWSFIHLMSIIGVRNKFFVGLNWMMSYFSNDKGDRIIIRKYYQQN